jgi:hypothetical protein
VSLTRPANPGRVAVVGSIVFIGVTILIIGGASQVNGPATVQRPPEIVMLQPNESEQLLPQGEVGATLRAGLIGQLSIDGRPIPQDQITGDPNLGEVLFDPGAGKDIREFAKGGHTAVIEWWPITIPTAEQARAEHQLRTPYSWSFNVG